MSQVLLAQKSLPRKRAYFHFQPAWLATLALLLCAGCHTFPPSGTPSPRKGDESAAAGTFFHTGPPVVLWMDPGGYDAYRVERRFSPPDKSGWDDPQAPTKHHTTPNRYGIRERSLTPAELERVRGGGWDLPLLQRVVDQFVIHYDASGTSRQCFKVLQDERDLSVHFLLDLDGTIYQTLDLKELARHATTSNDRSIGIELANMGAYGADEKSPLAEWYHTNSSGRTTLTIPPRFGNNPLRKRGFVGHPARPEPIRGTVQGRELTQYDFTPQQYSALIKLTATLCKVFPKITCDYPRDANGKLINHKLPDDVLGNYHGVLGHYHIQTSKVDPGPAFEFDKVINGARRIIYNSATAKTGALGFVP